MEGILAVVIGALYAGAVFLMLRRNAVQLVIGVMLLGHATNLLLFTIDGVTREDPPIVPEHGGGEAWPFANPLSQALILTAIVIGFGLQAFMSVLIQRTVRHTGTDDLHRLEEGPNG